MALFSPSMGRAGEGLGLLSPGAGFPALSPLTLFASPRPALKEGRLSFDVLLAEADAPAAGQEGVLEAMGAPQLKGEGRARGRQPGTACAAWGLKICGSGREGAAGAPAPPGAAERRQIANLWTRARRRRLRRLPRPRCRLHLLLRPRPAASLTALPPPRPACSHALRVPD